MAHRSFLTLSLSLVITCLSRVVTLPALSSLTDGGYNDYFAVPLEGERGSDQRMTPSYYGACDERVLKNEGGALED